MSHFFVRFLIFSVLDLENVFFLSLSDILIMFNSVTEAAVRRCSSKLLFLKISQYSQENTYVGVTLLKRGPNTNIWEYCTIFKNVFFTEHFRSLLFFLINKLIRFYLTEALSSKLFSGQFVIPKNGENVRKFGEFLYPWTQGFF